MAEPARAKLAAFDVTLRRATRIRWPERGVYGPEDRVAFDPGITDLIDLRYAPSRRSLGREPVHENLLIELAQPLSGSVPSLLRIHRVLYRAGTDRLTYQSTQVVGTLTLVEATPDHYLIDAGLSLINPEIDLEHRGTYPLAGRVAVPR